MTDKSFQSIYVKENNLCSRIMLTSKASVMKFILCCFLLLSCVRWGHTKTTLRHLHHKQSLCLPSGEKQGQLQHCRSNIQGWKELLLHGHLNLLPQQPGSSPEGTAGKASREMKYVCTHIGTKAQVPFSAVAQFDFLKPEGGEFHFQLRNH